jgi:WASH complex subunit strumpellin
MEKTLLGVIQVDPREILDQGIRKQLVENVAKALHGTLLFDRDVTRVAFVTTLEKLKGQMFGFRSSFEYIQDYINIYGLRIWQEELSRIINYNVEQECNRFFKKKILAEDSCFQSKSVPIPNFQPIKNSEERTFMGRLCYSLLRLTSPKTCVYSSQCGGWYGMDPPYTLHPTPYTLHPTPLHPTPLHPAP